MNPDPIRSSLKGVAGLLAIFRATDRAVTTRPLTPLGLGVFGITIFLSQYVILFEFYHQENAIREICYATMTLWGLLLILVMSGNLVTHELEDRTAVLLLSKPVRRSHFILGKYLGLMLALLRGIVLLSLIIFLTLWMHAGVRAAFQHDPWLDGDAWSYLLGGQVWPRVLFAGQAALLSLLQLSILCAFCVSLSTFFPIPVSITATALLYVVGNLTRHVVLVLKGSGSSILTLLGQGLAWILPNFGYMNPTIRLGEGKPLSASFLLGLVVYSILYTAVVLRVGSLFFERREIR